MATRSIDNLLNNTKIRWAGGQDVGIQNQSIGLAKFYRDVSRLKSGNTPQNLSFLGFGDSLNKVVNPLVDHLVNTLGAPRVERSLTGSGITIGGTGQGLAYTVENGATEITDSNYTSNGLAWLLNGTDHLVIAKNSSPFGTRATTIKIFYIAESGAGTFKVETSPRYDVQTWTERTASVDANNGGALALGVHTLSSLSYDNYIVRMTRLTGSVTILGVAWINDASTEPTIDFHSLNLGGLDPNRFKNVSDVTMTGIIEEIDPSVVAFRYNDGAVAHEGLVKLHTWLSNANIVYPLVLAFGPSPQSELTITDHLVEGANEYLDEISKQYGWVFLNGYKAFSGDFGGIDSLGWAADGMHLEVAADEYESNLMLQKIGYLSTLYAYASKVKSAKNDDITTRGLEVARVPSATPACTIDTDGTFGLDLRFFSQRHVYFRDAGGTNFLGVMGDTTDEIWAYVPISLGGSAGAPKIRWGAGSPEGIVASAVGSLYVRTDGGAGTTLYVKETGTGNTGWVAK